MDIMKLTRELGRALQQEQWLRKMFLHMKLWVVFQLNI